MVDHHQSTLTSYAVLVGKKLTLSLQEHFRLKAGWFIWDCDYELEAGY
jgi:hypothetical protein